MTADTSFFTNLITTEHQDSPKYIKTVSLSVQGYADQIVLCQSAWNLYDLDNAVGSQLDAVGLWIGFPRMVALDVVAYFSWDIPGIGWDQGIWWNIGDAENTITSLSDALYRKLLKVKIMCNHFDGSLVQAVNIVRAAVSDDGCTVTATEGSMSAEFTIAGPLSTIMRGIIEAGYLPLKPAGVTVTYKIVDA